ncbi:response regulator [Nesterenkonia halotolerans]|uniref:DNA-binding NarL/FixJ family response regulator n=1 Tax=Nesterenkonia halotolerans TaxID=225325 RepID=A0ABR9J3N5_9MICC|nr:response regulator transcription factor [Nesterenkonia halotolerans]MBE1513615.1 DNA-binding NarL/FixJ family response regulator [Nesterenkonia halotolerans]
MISVLIVDDQPVVRAGLAVVLNAEPDLKVLGQAADGAEAARLTAELAPDVVCMDVRMPGTDGITATREIIASGSTAKVLILTTFDIDEYVFAALEAGASGFLLKGAEEEVIAQAIRSVAAGGGTLDQRVTHKVITEFAQRSAGPRAGTQPQTLTPGTPALTQRETEVLRLITQGLSNAEIAESLVVEVTTVKYHVQSVLMKTQSRDRLQAAIWGLRQGLTGEDLR